MSGRSSYIARLIARNEPDALFEQRRTERTPALQPRDAVEARPVVDDPFEAVEEEADSQGETSFVRVPTPRPPRENITPQTTPPYPTVERANAADSGDVLAGDDMDSTFMPSAARPTETRRIEPPRQESTPTVTRRDAVDDDDALMLTAADQGEAPRRIDAPEGDSRNTMPTRADDDVETAAPMESPWTFADILAPFLKQFQTPNAGGDADEIHADVPRVSAASLEEDDAPNSAYDRMLPVIEADAPRITPIMEQDTPIVNIGDIVIEVTPPRPPDPVPRRSAAAPPAPPRLGVRSKRGFGLGQM